MQHLHNVVFASLFLVLLYTIISIDAARNDADEFIDTAESGWISRSGCDEVKTPEDRSSYDRWLEATMYPTEKKPKDIIDENTLLFIIDVQEDFVRGTFKMPCEPKQSELVAKLVDLVGIVKEKNGKMIASMDYHTSKHCSFLPNSEALSLCVDDGLATCEPREELCANTDRLPEEKNAERYQNHFPAHTRFTPRAKITEETIPTHGALLHPELAEALAGAARQNEGSVNVVFKAFFDDIDSFGAFPTDGKDKYKTGGFALGDSYPVSCLEQQLQMLKKKEKPSAKDAQQGCFPTMHQMFKKTPLEMIPTDQLVTKHVAAATGPVNIIVSGLVFDFCVKETAMYMQHFINKQHWESKVSVSVLTNLARPALEGIPGAPGIGPLASYEHIAETAEEIKVPGVELLTVEEINHAELADQHLNLGAQIPPKLTRREEEANLHVILDTEAGNHGH